MPRAVPTRPLPTLPPHLPSFPLWFACGSPAHPSLTPRLPRQAFPRLERVNCCIFHCGDACFDHPASSSRSSSLTHTHSELCASAAPDYLQCVHTPQAQSLPHDSVPYRSRRPLTKQQHVLSGAPRMLEQQQRVLAYRTRWVLICEQAQETSKYRTTTILPFPPATRLKECECKRYGIYHLSPTLELVHYAPHMTPAPTHQHHESEALMPEVHLAW